MTKSQRQRVISCTEGILYYSRNPNYTSKAASVEFCLLFQNNMCGKFTREDPQEFQHQISLHSETE